MPRSLLLVALALAGCATAPAQPPLIKTTVSGSPEGIFHGASPAAVQQKLVTHCIDVGGALQDVNALQVSCKKEWTKTERDDFAIYYGGGNDFHPRTVTTWTLISLPASAGVRVIAQAVILTDRLGGTQSEPMTNNTALNNMQKSLFAMGAE